MIKWVEAGLLVMMGLHLLACSKAPPPKNAPEIAQPAASPVPANPVSRTEAPAAEATATTSTTTANGRGVKIEMHNVLFHLTEDASAHVETLSGEIWPVGKFEMPTFGDKTSFEVHVAKGKVSITPEALSSIMNEYVFAAKDAPLKDLSVTIDKGRLKIKGKMHSRDIPFETMGTVRVTPDGRLRVHTEKVKALHVPVKGMMEVLGIELASLLNTNKIDGLDTEKNDLLLDLGQLLPPPHIRGKVTGVKVERNAIVTFFGDGEKSSTTSKEAGNYMIFLGNPVRFGKLTMENADITLLDLDPGDPLDWNQDHYKDQLVAGYSKITPSFGLRAYVKDFAKLSRSSSSETSSVPTH
jgi:hypothetical protein